MGFGGGGGGGGGDPATGIDKGIKDPLCDIFLSFLQVLLSLSRLLVFILEKHEGKSIREPL